MDPMDQYIESHVQDDILGVQIMLSIAGWPWSRSLLRDDLLKSYRERVSLIYRQILKIETSIRQDYMSAMYEMSVVPPAHDISNGRLDKSRLHIDVGPLRRAGSQFNVHTMENVLAGFGEQSGGVLCTVEVGLKLVEEESQQGGVLEKGRSTHHKSRSSSSRHSIIGAPEAISRANSAGDDPSRKLVERVLLKPKVLLESIDKYYDGQAVASMYVNSPYTITQYLTVRRAQMMSVSRYQGISHFSHFLGRDPASSFTCPLSSVVCTPGNHLDMLCVLLSLFAVCTPTSIYASFLTVSYVVQ